MRMPPKGSCIWLLGHQGVQLLERIYKDLGGAALLEKGGIIEEVCHYWVGFEVSEAQVWSQSLSAAWI